MSFLTRRRSARPLQDADSFVNSSTSSLKASESTTWRVEERLAAGTASLRKRLTSLASLTSKRPSLAISSSKSTEGIGYYSSGTYTRSRSPSPAPSLTIRLPNGLGPHAGPDTPGSNDSPHAFPSQQSPGDPAFPAPRRRSMSTPDIYKALPKIELLRWDEVSQSDVASEISISPGPFFDFSRISPDLLKIIFSSASRRDIASLAQVCSQFLKPAQSALYETLDLRDITDNARVDRCVSLLATDRHLSALVRTFATNYVPTPKHGEGAASLMTVTFAIAFTNMSHLESLTLPRFDAHLLFHTTFRLNSFTLLAETMTEDEIQSFLSWLGSQPTLSSLSLPNLSLDPSYNLNEQSLSPNTSKSSLSASIPSQFMLEDTTAPPRLSLSSSQILPYLRKLHAPTALAQLLVPGRPVRSLSLNLHSTLYDGLKPSALMTSLARSTDPIRYLRISQSERLKTDARTFERVLMSAGAELGDTVEVLMIEWVLDDEILYKQISYIISRFKALRTLRLRRGLSPFYQPPSDGLSPPPSPSYFFANGNKNFNYASPPTTPYTPGFPPTPRTPTSPWGRPSTSTSSTKRGSSDVPLSRTNERTHLGAWYKQCQTLRNVVFLSGAEWKVSLGVGRAIDSPLFTHVGIVKGW
ncbi:hypothetical protein K474DRAFT_1214317 [Panus rudis PR-1116 ss-1]|nr:hypothetical protein K474DRAFT_1214317 [Panus rudis PR-1116 ss-1]